MKLIINQPPGLKYVQPIEPVNPVLGTTWYDTKRNRLTTFDGTKWIGEEQRNWFGDASLGNVTISANTQITSTQDGDMIVLNYRNLTINSGITLTTTNRCRGLLIYVQENCTINGIISMTARGCHANPADSTITTNTPVAPSDNNAVPETGISIRRFALTHTNTHVINNLMFGCGINAVNSEKHQPVIDGDGILINIPRVGGAGGIAPTSGTTRLASSGGTQTNSSGGGGSGAGLRNQAGDGSAGTCFSGGSGGGGAQNTTSSTVNATSYGGAGGNASSDENAGSGAGNPSGTGVGNALDTEGDGTGGLIILIIGGNFSGSGSILSAGSNGGGTSTNCTGGGGSGGGTIVVLYANTNTFSGTIAATGGSAGIGSTADLYGGSGGSGSIIGPIKINPVD